MLGVAALACFSLVCVSACGGSSDKTSAKPPAGVSGPSSESSGGACAFFNENEVTSLFGTRPQREVDPLGIGGTASNCLWKAKAGGRQSLLQIAFFNGVQHYEQSDRFHTRNLAGLGDKAFINSGDLSGVTIEFVRAGKTYFVLFSIAKTVGATRNDANPKADQLLALIKHNLSRL